MKMGAQELCVGYGSPEPTGQCRLHDLWGCSLGWRAHDSLGAPGPRPALGTDRGSGTPLSSCLKTSNKPAQSEHPPWEPPVLPGHVYPTEALPSDSNLTLKGKKNTLCFQALTQDGRHGRIHRGRHPPRRRRSCRQPAQTTKAEAGLVHSEGNTVSPLGASGALGILGVSTPRWGPGGTTHRQAPWGTEVLVLFP